MYKATSPLDINLVRKVGYPPLCSEVLLIPLWRDVTRTPVGDLDPSTLLGFHSKEYIIFQILREARQGRWPAGLPRCHRSGRGP